MDRKQEGLEGIISYWYKTLSSVGQRTAAVVLTGENKEADHLMIRFLPFLVLEKHLDRVIVVSPSESIIRDAGASAINVVVRYCTRELIDGICRIQAVDSYYSRLPIYIDQFRAREDMDGYLLVGSYGLTLRDIVARVFLLLSHTPSEEEERQWECLLTERKGESCCSSIEWGEMTSLIPVCESESESIEQKVRDTGIVAILNEYAKNSFRATKIVTFVRACFKQQ